MSVNFYSVFLPYESALLIRSELILFETYVNDDGKGHFLFSFSKRNLKMKDQENLRKKFPTILQFWDQKL